MVSIKEIDGVQLSSSSSNSRYGKREDCVVVKRSFQFLPQICLKIMF